MRFGLFAALSLLAFTGCSQHREVWKPVKPAVQIIIPDSPGWSPSTNNNQIYTMFDRQLEQRIQDSGGVIQRKTWQQKDLSTLVTLYGDHPEQIITITLPFLRQAGLPAGSAVTKYEGPGGLKEQRVDLGS